MNDNPSRLEDNGTLSRDKYNFIVGLLAAMLAFSAFQGTLTHKLDFGFFDASVLQLMGAFGVIIGLSAYIFAWHFAKMNTRYENAPHLRFLRPTADALYVVALAFPPIMVLLWLLNQGLLFGVDALSHATASQREAYIHTLSAIATLITSIGTGIFVYRYTKHRIEVSREVEIIDLRQQSMASIENAGQLYTKGNYGASIMEGYKAVLLVLRAVLLSKGMRLASYERSHDIMYKAQRSGIITKEEQKILEKMRHVRNKAAHLDISLTKNQADQVLQTAHSVLEKISTKIE